MQMNATQYNLNNSSYTPTCMSNNQSTRSGRKKFMDDIVTNMRKSKPIDTNAKPERVERNVIIRKNSSKSLLRDGLVPKTPRNQNIVNLN